MKIISSFSYGTATRRQSVGRATLLASTGKSRRPIAAARGTHRVWHHATCTVAGGWKLMKMKIPDIEKSRIAMTSAARKHCKSSCRRQTERAFGEIVIQQLLRRFIDPPGRKIVKPDDEATAYHRAAWRIAFSLARICHKWPVSKLAPARKDNGLLSSGTRPIIAALPFVCRCAQ